ncbi:MAG: ATP-binding cassette domain-containing protein [SAR324 cluster bacterium]|jgi:ABC-type sugar transport system ATPase subunit|nr:ATP-binding cassette domain-containing protein [SAR324 cluster bacterium]MDP6285523.1 ATP-binding cassette domain-containing protein [Acidimicrobiales bacterium]MDP7333495.1 ATP-binding cassette domain-containing protein [SAR324 cluster bacterium]MDP7502056.1 ATP-binding cassette domain-containing protein [SAR324 cluster bacterium]|tara:strand:+ start:3962 stop:4708 length:747 start_codon:yes stop_codon:yes gene_type:complete
MTDQLKPVLEVKNVSKFFGGVEALKQGSLKLFPGEVLAIVGANGAGKSTLIKIIAGVLNPDQGFVKIRGKHIGQDDHNVSFIRQQGVEVVYQDLAIVPNMSAPYNLFLGRIPRKFGIFVDEKKMLEKTEEVLAELNIETVQNLIRPISEMSGGQQQSIAIGRAIAWGKDIVILDEPTAALGPNETLEVERIIREIRKRGTAIILISHNLDQVFRVADRLVVVHKGITSREFLRSEVTLEELVKSITTG